MTRQMQFAFGGLGGLLPVLATLVAVDLTTISAMIDKHELTEGYCVGIGLRIVGLFLLGGIMAALNTDVRNPLALVQIGIAAPALVASYLSGAAINKGGAPAQSAGFLIAPAHAEEIYDYRALRQNAGFWSDVSKGLQPGLGQQTAPVNSYRVIDRTTSICVDVNSSQVSTPQGLEALKQSFPPSKYTVEPGSCH